MRARLLLFGGGAGEPNLLDATFGGLSGTMVGGPLITGTMVGAFGGLTALLSEQVIPHFWAAQLLPSTWRADLTQPPWSSDDQPPPWDADLHP